MKERASGPISVSAMVFTLDEEMHLPSCLESLRWCDDVVVVDSFSSDRTVEIALASGARVLQNRFTGFGDQRNWALANAMPKHPWVLILDADERVPPAMADELRATIGSVPHRVAAFRTARRFRFWGQWLRHSSLYPTYVVRLVRCGRVRYVNRGHAETQEIDGDTGTLASDLIDENLKGLGEWFERQNRYSGRDAEYELEMEKNPWRAVDLASADPLARRAALKRLAARIPGRPIWFFFYSYVLRGGFLDGRNGLVFCVLKSFYQVMVSMKKCEVRQQRGKR
jgi:glycosyltransferase involved in cell wall biosynthesis